MKCFVSYSWDSPTHKNWVRGLADKLVSSGIDVILDQWEAYPGMDLTAFMESSIRESDYVVMICTTTYASKANAGKGGVGYEKMIVTGEIYLGVAKSGKFIPIIRSGEPSNALPSFLKSRYFLDFRTKLSTKNSFSVLLRHMYGSPKYKKPPIGKSPSYAKRFSNPKWGIHFTPPAPASR